MSLEDTLKRRFGYSEEDKEIIRERRKLGLEKSQEELNEDVRNTKIQKIKKAASELSEELGVKTQIKAIQGGYAIVVRV